MTDSIKIPGDFTKPTKSKILQGVEVRRFRGGHPPRFELDPCCIPLRGYAAIDWCAKLRLRAAWTRTNHYLLPLDWSGRECTLRCGPSVKLAGICERSNREVAYVEMYCDVTNYVITVFNRFCLDISYSCRGVLKSFQLKSFQSFYS